MTAVLNGRLDKGLNLDDVTTRANMVTGIMSVVGLGVAGIQLDLEPYPTTAGFVSLLDEVHAALTAHGSSIRLSVVAPATTTRWNPTFLQAVSQRVDQVDPLYYDSSIEVIATYETWVESSLAYYTANTAPNARIVPVLASYKKNAWHLPAIENITTGTVALSAGIGAASRVDGAGIWWWWGFFYGENGKYDPAQDQAEWQSATRPLFGV